MLDFGRVVGLWTRKRYFGGMWSKGDEEELFLINIYVELWTVCGRDVEREI